MSAMGREQNVAVFQDTERIVKGNEKLREAVRYSTDNQKLILETDTNYGNDHEQINNGPARVTVTKQRTFQAASKYTRENKTAVLNFASATTPGGGVVKGSSAQEESLCRCSTLYFSLNTPVMWDGFYTPHRQTQDPKHNDDIIYTPDVYVIKTDTDSPVLMEEGDWYKVNVITCAAPNLRQMPSNQMNTGDGVKNVKMTDRDLLALHEKRLSRILQVAKNEGNEIVILGAFGCGAFENKPEVVAQAARNVVKRFLYDFTDIEFAVYCPPNDDTNYKVFDRVISPLNK